MKRPKSFLLLCIVLSVIIGGSAGATVQRNMAEVNISQHNHVEHRKGCYEDEPFLMGKGNYNGSTGTWHRYVCVHVDRVQLNS